MAPSTDLSAQRRSQAAGFTLVELLVTVLIGGFVTTGLAAMLSAEFRSSSAILRYQRLARHASQTRGFIEAEAATASRLQQVDANSLRLFGVHPGSTTQYTITYDVVAVSAVNPSGAATTYRGPFVLRRVGPPYAANGTFPAAANQTSVILDGLNNATSFTVNANGSSLGASVSLAMVNAGLAYQPDFFITVATSPALGVLQQPRENFVANCGTGCRNTGAVQEWDTRWLNNTATIVPEGSPAEVIVYFNANRPTTTNAIRRTSSTTSPVQSCIRTSCYLALTEPPIRNYQINTRVDRLVFLDYVVGVPAN